MFQCMGRLLVETSLFGVRLTASDIPSAVEAIAQAGESGRSGLICVANVDMVTRAKRDARLLATMQKAEMVVTDGTPLVWALRRKGLRQSQRVYGPDLMRALCVRLAEKRVPVFLYGGSTVDELRALVVQLRVLAPGIDIAGAVCPPLLPADPPFDPRIVEEINGCGARIAFVGLGCPKQEYWMQTHAPALRALSMGVGLAFAQLAGMKATAPKWMQRNGLEWLFRLIQEPRRLWRRYLVGNSLFVWYLLREWSFGSFSRHR